MTGNPSLKTISESEIESLIAELNHLRATTLVLLGPSYNVPASPDQWPETWQTAQALYQLNQVVPGLAAKIGTLSNVLSLDLSCNKIGDEGAASLAALTQLRSLSLKYNDISSTGAARLATLANLQSLDLQSNYIGDDGIKSLSSLTRLTSLNIWGNSVSAKGAEYLASF